MITTGEAIRTMLPYYKNSDAMRLAVNERMRASGWKRNFSSTLIRMCAEKQGDAALLQELDKLEAVK